MHPEVASNWRRWGKEAAEPSPGFVAVRRGTPTGSTGSHVTFVESYDPKSGTFVGLGGDQGRPEVTLSARDYQFFAPRPAGAASEAVPLPHSPPEDVGPEDTLEQIAMKRQRLLEEPFDPIEFFGTARKPLSNLQRYAGKLSERHVLGAERTIKPPETYGVGRNKIFSPPGPARRPSTPGVMNPFEKGGEFERRGFEDPHKFDPKAGKDI